MRGLMSTDGIAKRWLLSVLLFGGALLCSLLFTYGSGRWPVYAQATLFITAVYFLLTSVGIFVSRGTGAPPNKQMVNALLEGLPLQAFVTDDIGRLQHINSALQNAAGTLLTQQGREVFAVVHPEDELQVRKLFSEGVISRSAFVFAFRHRVDYGETRRFEARLRRIENYSEGLGCWVGVLVEITNTASASIRPNGADGQAERASLLERTDHNHHSFMEVSAGLLTAILVNSHACMRFLSAEPMLPSDAMTCVERILRDAKEMASQTKALPPAITLSRQSLPTESASMLRCP